MIYEYTNLLAPESPPVRIAARMTNPPPERLWFNVETGEWMPVNPAETMPEPWAPCCRIYSLPGVKVEGSASVNIGRGKPVPASSSLPRLEGGEPVNRYGHTVLEHKDGALSTIDGRPIIDSATAAERECARGNFVRTNSDDPAFKTRS